MTDLFSLLIYKLLFVAELKAAVLIYSHSLKKRSHSLLRMISGTMVMAAAAILLPVSRMQALPLSGLFLSLFLLEIFYLLFCCRESVANIFFCGIAGYTTQHLASLTCSLVKLLSGMEGRSFWEAGSLVVYILSYGLVYCLLYLGFGRRMEENEDLRLKRTTTIALAGLIILADVVINAVVLEHSESAPDSIYMAVNYAYGILSCLLIMFLLFSMISGKRMAQENEIMRQLLASQQQQYTIAKDNIERINIKCHDLKHQIHEIAGRAAISTEEVQEMEEVISIYDAAVKTGNEALDTILTEKSLQCNANGIRITCMADGEQLSFMRESDIYTLFGNAVDNAIEAVMKLRDPEKRVIGLKVRRNGKFVCVHIYNYYAGSLEMMEGLPVTTKEDREEHGFGMRSMRRITDRYRGTMEIETEEEIFNLNIVFPVS